MNSVVNWRRGAIIALLGVTVLPVGPAIAAADDTTAVPKAAVHYEDLDLSIPVGRIRLRRRVSRAADQVCNFNDILPILAVRLRGECRQHALASADVRVAALVERAARGVAPTAGRRG